MLGSGRGCNCQRLCIRHRTARMACPARALCCRAGRSGRRGRPERPARGGTATACSRCAGSVPAVPVELSLGILLANQDTELTQNHSGRKAASRNSWGPCGLWRATLSRGGGAFLRSCFASSATPRRKRNKKKPPRGHSLDAKLQLVFGMIALSPSPRTVAHKPFSEIKRKTKA